METAFTPLSSLAGGALIGVAATALMALHGRVAGVSGLMARVLAAASDPEARRTEALDWRLAMLFGLIAAPIVFGLFAGPAPFHAPVSGGSLLVGGVLVGIGVAFGNGCTSGHGVCGLARGSRRSLAAVVCFMAVAAATVFVSRHALGG